MDNTKKEHLQRKPQKKEIPRAAYEGVLTIDVDAQVESMEEQEDARWHQLLNAHRTRKVLTGQLGGIEKLESGWMVAVTYYNGFRIIIPMNEMMINLSEDGRENADTLKPPGPDCLTTCLAVTLILSSKIWMPKAAAWWLPEKMPCRKKDKHSTLGKQGKSLFLYPGRIVEARVIAVAPKAVRLEVFGVEVSVRARDMAWEWMGMPEKNSRWKIWSLLW